MKICVYTITHNAADLLPFFIRHYLSFAQRIVAWDDKSDDATRQILGSHALIETKEWPYQPGINEDLFLKFWQEVIPEAIGEFDWLMIVDPDEFLWHKDMPGLLWEEKKRYTEVVRTTGFNMVGNGYPKDDGKSQIYEINPMGVPAPVYSKPVVFRPHVPINWVRGKHALENCNPKVSADAPIKLLHYRYMGAEYTRKRNAQNYARCGMQTNDKGAAWSCAPDYDGVDKEHSPKWADAVKSKGVNVLELA